MDFKNISIEEVSGGVLIITLNRPKALNSLTEEMDSELEVAFRNTRSNNKIKVVVVTGAGKAFCAGGDITEMHNWPSPPELRRSMSEMVGGIIKLIFTIEKPVIAMVNGAAIAAGLNLALACDLIIASESARFGEAYVNVGLSSDWGGNYFLPRRIGLAKAKELYFTGRVIGAKEAERIGLINQVVPDEQLVSTTMSLAKQLANGPARIIGMTKKLLNNSMDMDLASALELEAYSVSLCSSMDEFKEGYNAFLQKRKPVFT